MDREERIARAMCVADNLDPDEITSGGERDFAESALDVHGYAVVRKGPAWKMYVRRARLFLAADAEMAAMEQER